MIKQYYQQTALGACILMSLLLLLTLLHTISDWHSDWTLSHQKIKTIALAPIDDLDHLIENLPDQHLFGNNPAINQVGDMPISSLQLRVTGIIKNESDAASKALISIAGSPSKIYHTGERIEGIKIYAITPEAVVLDNNGKLEKLPLPRPALLFKNREPKEP